MSVPRGFTAEFWKKKKKTPPPTREDKLSFELSRHPLIEWRPCVPCSRHTDPVQSDVKHETPQIQSALHAHRVTPVEHFLAVLQLACLRGLRITITVSVIAVESQGLIINHPRRSDDSIFLARRMAALSAAASEQAYAPVCSLANFGSPLQQVTQRQPVCCHGSWCDCFLWKLTMAWRKSQKPWPWLLKSFCSNRSAWGKCTKIRNEIVLFTSALCPQCLFCILFMES